MTKACLWGTVFMVMMIAATGPVQQEASGADEIITRDIPHQY